LRISEYRVRNEELHNLYTLLNVISVIISIKINWVGNLARIAEMRKAYLLVGKPEAKGPFGRPGRRWEDNIKLDLKKIWSMGTDWIHLAQDRYQWRALVKPYNEPSDTIKGWEFLDQLSDY
jgi:hypothetical protein